MEKLTEQAFKNKIRNFITLNGVTKDEIRQEFNEIFDKLKEFENADVVPRSEVEEIVKFKDMAYAELKSLYIEAKQEVAREIFAEIEKIALTHIDRYGRCIIDKIDLAELKKKYTGE